MHREQVQDAPSLWWFAKVFGMLGLIFLYISKDTGWYGQSVEIVSLTVGHCLVFVGAGFSWWHYYLLKREVGDLARPSKLLTNSGAFALVRHPMYLGDIILSLGFALVALNWISLTILLAVLVSLFAQARVEDGELAEAFPEEFEEWRSRTALILPKIL